MFLRNATGVPQTVISKALVLELDIEPLTAGVGSHGKVILFFLLR